MLILERYIINEITKIIDENQLEVGVVEDMISISSQNIIVAKTSSITTLDKLEIWNNGDE